MHVFVTGATGFIGFHTVRALLAAGHTVRLGVRNTRKMEDLYGPLGIDTSDHVVGGITDEDAISRGLEGCDGVVHTAAMVSLDANKAELVYNTNVTGTRLVIGGAVERGLKSIVHVSSVTALYDSAASVLDETVPVAVGATSGYGRSKAESERYVRELIEEGANIAITYPCTVLGPDDPAMSEGSQGIAIFFNQAFVLTTTGIQIIDVRDLAQIHVALLENKLSGPFMVAGHYRSWAEFGHVLERVTGRRLRKVPLPGWLLRKLGSGVDIAGKFASFDTPVTSAGVTYATRWVYADDRKVREALNYSYRSLDETMTDTIEWLAESGHIGSYWAAKLPHSSPR